MIKTTWGLQVYSQRRCHKSSSSSSSSRAGCAKPGRCSTALLQIMHFQVTPHAQNMHAQRAAHAQAGATNQPLKASPRGW